MVKNGADNTSDNQSPQFPRDCANCQVIRELVHRNGVVFKTFSAHLWKKYFHLVITTEIYGNDGRIADSLQVAVDVNHVTVETVLENYLDMQNQGGFEVVSDSLNNQGNQGSNSGPFVSYQRPSGRNIVRPRLLFGEGPSNLSPMNPFGNCPSNHEPMTQFGTWNDHVSYQRPFDKGPSPTNESKHQNIDLKLPSSLASREGLSNRPSGKDLAKPARARSWEGYMKHNELKGKAANMSARDFKPYMHLNLADAAEILKVTTTAIKFICRRDGIQTWPRRKIQSLNKRIARVKQEMTKPGNAGRMAALRLERSLLRAKKELAYRPHPPEEEPSSDSSTETDEEVNKRINEELKRRIEDGSIDIF